MVSAVGDLAQSNFLRAWLDLNQTFFNQDLISTKLFLPKPSPEPDLTSAVILFTKTSAQSNFFFNQDLTSTKRIFEQDLT